MIGKLIKKLKVCFERIIHRICADFRFSPQNFSSSAVTPYDVLLGKMTAQARTFLPRGNGRHGNKQHHNGEESIFYLEASFVSAQAWRNGRLSKVPLEDRFWLVWKTIQMAGSKIPRSLLIIHLKANDYWEHLRIARFVNHAQQGTKTMGTRVATNQSHNVAHAF